MLNKILDLSKKGYSIKLSYTDFRVLEIIIDKRGLRGRQFVSFEEIEAAGAKNALMVSTLNYMEAELERKLNDGN